MIKAVHNCHLPVLLDIRTKDGRQVFRGEVKISDGAFFDVDNAKVFINEDQINGRYIYKVEVQ